MDKIDYIGLSVLITTLTSALISLLAALQSLRNGKRIQIVEKAVNGPIKELVEQNKQIQAERSGFMCGYPTPQPKK